MLQAVAKVPVQGFSGLQQVDIFIIEPRHVISNNVVCATSKASDQPAHMRSLIKAFDGCLNNPMTVKPLTEHHLEFLSLKRDCTGSYESTLVEMPHCCKSHVAAHIFIFHYSHQHPVKLQTSQMQTSLRNQNQVRTSLIQGEMKQIHTAKQMTQCQIARQNQKQLTMRNLVILRILVLIMTEMWINLIIVILQLLPHLC